MDIICWFFTVVFHGPAFFCLDTRGVRSLHAVSAPSLKKGGVIPSSTAVPIYVIGQICPQNGTAVRNGLRKLAWGKKKKEEEKKKLYAAYY